MQSFRFLLSPMDSHGHRVHNESVHRQPCLRGHSCSRSDPHRRAGRLSAIRRTGRTGHAGANRSWAGCVYNLWAQLNVELRRMLGKLFCQQNGIAAPHLLPPGHEPGGRRCFRQAIRQARSCTWQGLLVVPSDCAARAYVSPILFSLCSRPALISKHGR